MSWKNRKRKIFNRLVSRLKEAPIYMIDQYIIIDEAACYMKQNRRGFNHKSANLKEYENQVQQGRINSSFDFDNYFNPDITLNLTFESNRERASQLIQSYLHDIASRWNERLKNLFPNHEYTIVQYYDSENLDWYLDFYNGKKRLEKAGEERIKNITYIS